MTKFWHAAKGKVTYISIMKKIENENEKVGQKKQFTAMYGFGLGGWFLNYTMSMTSQS